MIFLLDGQQVRFKMDGGPLVRHPSFYRVHEARELIRIPSQSCALSYRAPSATRLSSSKSSAGFEGTRRLRSGL